MELGQLLQALIEDRQSREMAIAEERRQRAQEMQLREEEMRRKEEEFREERERREEEVQRREREMRQQFELLQGLVEGIRADRVGVKETDVKFTKLQEKDDIEAYLKTFERVMTAYEIPQERWSFKLAPQLIGKAQQAYAALDATDAEDYDSLKHAILGRYGISEESHRQRFRRAKKEREETHKEFGTRLADLVDKWMADCEDAGQVKEKIVMEQLINTLPEPVRIYVKEHKPKDSTQAGELADDYIQARGLAMEKKPTTEKRCHRCGRPGHLMKDCRQREEQTKQSTERKNESTRKPLKDIECYSCGEKGHYSSRCPHSAMFCAQKESMANNQWKRSIIRPGRKGGKELSSILLDTGCSRTLIRQDLVSNEELLEGEMVTVCCAHGDTAMYPLARVTLEVEGKDVEVEAAVVERLPMEVLLGTDFPQLKELLMLQPRTKRDGGDQRSSKTGRSKTKGRRTTTKRVWSTTKTYIYGTREYA